MITDKLKYFVVKKIYADHNDSRAVKRALKDLLSRMPPSFEGLNIGAGKTKVHPQIKNLEIEPGEGIDFVGSVEDIPCPSDSFDLVISQEVLEHVESPTRAMQEIHRVLRTGGYAYIQLPFVIGYHPCPHDYWRFTHEGITELAESQHFQVLQTSITVGPAVGLYRILVEFLAITCSALYWRLYKPAKLFFALLCYPLKLLDPILMRTREAGRIAGGYFVICRKQ